MMFDDELYYFFYPDKFKPKSSYAPACHSELREEAFRKALKDFYTVAYNTLMPYIKELSKNRKNETKSRDIKSMNMALCEVRIITEGMVQSHEYGTQVTVLELGDLVSVIENQEKNVLLVELNDNDRLEHLLAKLIIERQNRLIARLTKNAQRKYPHASLETLDCEAKGISRDVIVHRASLSFVSAATNRMMAGATGAGKTYLSCVLGVEACKQTLRTFSIRMPDRLGHFQNHKDTLREQIRYRKRLGNDKVLIIDELLNYEINERETKFI